MNKIVKEDLENLINNNKFLYDELDNTTILVTGASGLIGSYIVNSILMYNKQYDKNIKVIALVHSKNKADIIFNDYLDSGLLYIYECDICDKINIDDKIDYIIHGASITSSKMFVDRPVDVIKTAIIGTMNVLDLAVKNSIKSFVYMSSIEAYGIFNDSILKEIKEDELGNLDITNVRSSYPESKRMVENLVISYSSQYNIDAKIVRLTQTFSAGIDYKDNRVFAEFSRCIVENKNLVLHSKGETTKNFCYTVDAVSAIFYVLLKGVNNEIYNIASDNSIISTYELAKLMIEVSKSNVELIVKNDENSTMGYFPTFKAYLNTDKLKKLGWSSKYTIKDMVYRLIEYMKSI